jgi:hypothetical protein
VQSVTEWQGCRERQAKMLTVEFSRGSIEHQRGIAEGFLTWLHVARVRMPSPGGRPVAF